MESLDTNRIDLISDSRIVNRFDISMADLHNVYDFYCPSPPSLKELASMEIALTLWRREIQDHITSNGTLREHCPPKKTPLRSLIPKVPSSIFTMIENYVIKLQDSIPLWLLYYVGGEVFKLDVLNHFLNFVCDFDGTIHHRKTAKRFIACDGIDDVVKFKMACENCFEDDISRLWPKVSSYMNTNYKYMNLDDDPHLYYWLCRLKNQLHEVDLRDYTSCVEELVLYLLYEHQDFDIALAEHCPGMAYFLNHMPSNIRLEHVIYRFDSFGGIGVVEPTHSYNFIRIFFRHIMAKFDKAEFKTLVNEVGHVLVIFSQPEFVLHVWAYIKNEITNDGFSHIIKYILKEQTEYSSRDDPLFHYCEIWTTASDRLKRAFIRDAVLFDDETCFIRADRQHEFGDRRNISLLTLILSETPIEDRRKFWNAHLENLISDIRPDDFRILMNLCFDGDENQINEFKNDFMLKYFEKIQYHFKSLLEDGCFKELEEFLTLCCPNKRTMKEIRLNILQKNFTNDYGVIYEANSLLEFIDKAYEDNLATEFKNKLLVARDLKTVEDIKYCIYRCRFRDIMGFIDNFAASDEIAAQIKKRNIVPTLNSVLMKPSFFRDLEKNFDWFERFLSWLFQNPDEIVEFKEGLDIDAVIRGLILDKTNRVNEVGKYVDIDWFRHCFQTKATPDSIVKKFLNWYFVTPEAVEEFEEKYAHNPMFTRLL